MHKFVLKDINEVNNFQAEESEEITLLTAPWPIGQRPVCLNPPSSLKVGFSSSATLRADYSGTAP